MPPLVIVNVPPSRSVTAILPSRAFFASSRDLLLDVGEAELVGVADDRHHQPLLGADRHADVVEVLVDDVGAVDAGVDQRERLECLDGGLHEHRHEPELDAVLLLELLVVLRPQVHDRGHVGLVERGQRGGGVLRFEQPLGDPLADLRHRLAGDSRAGGRRRRWDSGTAVGRMGRWLLPCRLRTRGRGPRPPS